MLQILKHQISIEKEIIYEPIEKSILKEKIAHFNHVWFSASLLIFKFILRTFVYFASIIYRHDTAEVSLITRRSQHVSTPPRHTRKPKCDSPSGWRRQRFVLSPSKTTASLSSPSPDSIATKVHERLVSGSRVEYRRRLPCN